MTLLVQNSVRGDKAEEEGVTALVDFLPKKSRSGLLSSNKGGMERSDSTFGKRISVEEIKT